MNDRYPQSAENYSSTDLGLRSFLLGTFQYMIMAMGISAVAAWAMSNVLFDAGQPTSVYYTMYASPLKWAVWLAPMAFVWIMGARYHKLSRTAANLTLVGYSALIGVWLSALLAAFVMNNPQLGAKVFFLSIALFGTFCLFGYTTKFDLSKIGPMAGMALLGVIVAMVINIAVFKSTGFDLVISGVGLLIMSVVTAFQLQSLKQIYYSVAGNADEAHKASVFGAIGLYTSFINIFLFLLRFMSNE